MVGIACISSNVIGNACRKINNLLCSYPCELTDSAKCAADLVSISTASLIYCLCNCTEKYTSKAAGLGQEVIQLWWEGGCKVGGGHQGQDSAAKVNKRSLINTISIITITTIIIIVIIIIIIIMGFSSLESCRGISGLGWQGSRGRSQVQSLAPVPTWS